jgi:hypothetical protein
LASRDKAVVALVRKFWAELAIVFGCAALVAGGFAFERLREPFGTAPPPSAAQAERPLPALATLKRNARATSYSIDTIAQDASPIVVAAAKPMDVPVVSNRPVVVAGWAADGKAAAGGVYVLVDGVHAYAAVYGADRPDVAAAIGGGMYSNTGFTARIPAGALTPGRHSISLRIIDANRTGYYSGSSPAMLVVRDARN